MSAKNYLLEDSTTGKQIELEARTGTLGPDVFDIRSVYAEQGAFTFDPGFASTASCESKITFIDGVEGILLYRGYPVDQLPRKASSPKFATCSCTANCPPRRNSKISIPLSARIR